VTLRPLPCLALALALTGCALPEVTPTRPAAPSVPAAATAARDPGPVVLTLGGQGAAQCRFTLFARYPENLEPHTVDLRSRVTSDTTAFSNEAGLYVELPMLGVDWTEATPAGMLTAITNGSADEGCAQLRGLVEVATCQSGNCPQYVADEHSEIPLTVRSGANR
jgi:hypothetical protein